MKTKLIKLFKYLSKELIIWLVLSIPFVIVFWIWFGFNFKAITLGLIFGIISAQLNAIEQQMK